MSSFADLLEDEVDDTPAAASPSFLQRIKSIDWKTINNRATIATNILSSIAAIIDSIQRVVSYTNSVRQSLPLLLSLKSKVNSAQAVVRPLAAAGRTTYTYRPRTYYGPPQPPMESVAVMIDEALTESTESWEKVSLVATAIGAIVALISQLVSLIADFPEYKEKIGNLVSGMKKDAEDLQKEIS
jgi:hypothetical protein